MDADPAESAGGTAYGLSFRVKGADASSLNGLSSVMMEVGGWVVDRAGYFLGHVKMSLDSGPKGAMTLNLTDIGNGVERHGDISFPADLEGRFMAAVLDVDKGGLERTMTDLMERRGYAVNKRKGNLIGIG